MTRPEPLATESLYRTCELERLAFDTSDELEGLDQPLGQERALDALTFGTGMPGNGYNLFVLGPQGYGKHDVVERFLNERAASEAVPNDWCYLYDFEQPNTPKLVDMPAGQGDQLRKDLDQLAEDLRSAVPATFESDEYQNRLQEIRQEFRQKQQDAFKEIQDEAESKRIALMQSQTGFSFAPKKANGEVMSAEEFQNLEKSVRDRLQEDIEALQAKLQNLVQQVPKWQKETQEKVRELNQQMANLAVGERIGAFKESYNDYPRVQSHLDAIQQDVVDHVEVFAGQQDEKNQMGMMQVLARYGANVLVNHANQDGAPVRYEDLPTHQRLVGRVEHRVQQGALLTDFRLIRAGTLHTANGGYVVIDARKLLMQPLAWESLKRALYSQKVRIESPEQLFSVMSTESLEPEPMPLSVKVVLIGDRLLYYLLAAYDPDFMELFKIQADFEEDLARTEDNEQLYARLIATMAQRAELAPLQRDAMARLIEHASRLAGDRERLTAQQRTLGELLREAAFWAREDGASSVGADHIQKAIDQKTHRSGRIRDQMDRSIQRGILMVTTSGEAVGQINGLSVMQLGDSAFGRPTRITATARLGAGKVVDIERDANLSGDIHAKGVMILSHCLAGRYARDRPLSLSASLAFEQNYAMVDGDSASVAELCALLSVLGDAPLKQGVAVTGSVNQMGEVQPVGGVNEKIEGFFEVCQARGLDGQHGVILPAANVEHLMLRSDVREAVDQGRFHVYPASTVDEVLALLTDLEPGERDAQGFYPPGSLNRRVEDRLIDFSERHRRWDQQANEEQSSNDQGQ
ncbi:Lon protease family protein [Halomonadaceae bacterium KBTZ08]